METQLSGPRAFQNSFIRTQQKRKELLRSSRAETLSKILVERQIFWAERTGKMENGTPIRDCADDMAVTFKYWETVIRKSYSQPEKELMLAVLKDAVMIYKKHIHSGNALFKEAETWLFDRERDWLFSFGTVCAVLGLSPEKIRQNLLAWKLNALSAVIDRGRQSRCDQMISYSDLSATKVRWLGRPTR